MRSRIKGLFMADTSPGKASHPYQLADPSPWSILVAFSVLVTAVGAVLAMHHCGSLPFLMGIGFFVAGLVGWLFLFVSIYWWGS